MQRLKNILLRNSGAITLGLGITNLWIWLIHGAEGFFLFSGIILTALGLMEIASEFSDEDPR